MSDHETDKPPPFERERLITPFEPFDGRPKVAAERPTTGPLDPFAGLPRIPRQPRMPSDVGELGIEHTRDTEPAKPVTGYPGDPPLSHDSENTPPDGPFAIRQVLIELKSFREAFKRMERHCEVAANNSIATSQDVKLLRLEFQELKKEHGDRLVRLELDRLWIPRAVSTASLLIALATALFVFIKLH